MSINNTTIDQHIPSNTEERLSYWRIIDVNYNRTKEGLRVIEEVSRFILNDQKLSQRIKLMRQTLNKLKESNKHTLSTIKARDVSKDVGANAKLQVRKGIQDIVLANCSRVTEALRVLEEFNEPGMAYQELRFQAYDVEQQLIIGLNNILQNK